MSEQMTEGWANTLVPYKQYEVAVEKLEKAQRDLEVQRKLTENCVQKIQILKEVITEAMTF